MGTTWLREFTGGLDSRRLPETSAGGVLVRGRDGHINRGGEFEQRADFVTYWDAPPNTCVGLAETPAGLVVFGHLASAPAGLPANITYQQLAHPAGEALTDVPFATLYNGKVAAIGEFANGDRFVYFDGTRVSDENAPPNLSGSGTPNTLLTAVDKLFVGSGTTLFFSAVAAPTDFGAGAGVGDGFINMATRARGSEEVIGLAEYQDFTAVFSRRVIQVWFFDADPANSRPNQVLAKTGAISSRAITPFGDGDVFYLDRSGVRSLRARDSSNSARTTDVGSAIDTLVAADIAALSQAEQQRAISVIEPTDGRYWVSIGEKIYVFSYFPGSQVSAWTEYRPGFAVHAMVEHNDRVWLRSGDRIYVYGSASGPFQYSASVRAEAWTPYLDGDDPTRNKRINGFDAAVRGEWEVRLAFDPNDETASDVIARIGETTYNDATLTAYGSGTHFQVRFRCTAPAGPNAPAVVSSAVIHHDMDPSEDK